MENLIKITFVLLAMISCTNRNYPIMEFHKGIDSCHVHGCKLIKTNAFYIRFSIATHHEMAGTLEEVNKHSPFRLDDRMSLYESDTFNTLSKTKVCPECHKKHQEYCSDKNLPIPIAPTFEK